MATNPIQESSDGRISRGRRVHPRARVALPAVVETMDGRKKVKLTNLSSAGAMVEGTRSPQVGRDLVLKCHGLDAMGVVVWEDGDRRGIEFYDPIESQEVVRQRQLSDDHLAQERWRVRDELINAARKWSTGKN